MAADDHQPHPKHGKTTTATAVSPNANTKKPKERVPFKSDLTEINQYLMCPLCSGYLIDATAIIECQHTFCKSCILKYLETNSYCPICDVQLNKAKPHLSLRSDVIVQRLVYKLVPGLLVSELRRRRDCAQVGSTKQEAAESASSGMALEVEAASDLSTILSLEDVVSLSIQYYRSDETDGETKQQIATATLQKQEQQTTQNIHNIQDIKSPTESDEVNDRRYLRCPVAVSVGLLKKFIRMKYGLSDDYRVDLLYNGNREDILENDLTLLDVAFIFKWNKDQPMRLDFRIFDRNVKSMPSRPGTKRAAPSMMDEPPDDDAASGPQNRPSMTSASPSSKIPRLSDNSTTGANNNAGNTGGSYTRSTSTLSSSAPVYDFSEGNSDNEEITKNVKPRGFHRKYSSSSSNSNNSGKSNIVKRSPSTLRSHTSRSQSSESKGVVKAESSNSSNNKKSISLSGRGRSNSVGNSSGNNMKDEEEDDSDSNEESSSDDGKVSSERSEAVTNSRLRSAAQQVMQSQVNGGVKLSFSAGNIVKRGESSSKISSGGVTRTSERKHKHRHHKMKHKDKSKGLKLNLNLKQSLTNHQSTTTSSNNTNQSISQNHKLSGKEVKFSLGKVSKQQNSGLGNNNKGVDGKGNNGNGSGGNNSSQQSSFPNSMKSAASAHLSNISKSISVSIGVNMSSGNNNQNQNSSSGNVTNSSSYSQSSNKGSQFSSKILASTTGLLPKNTGIEIQPTTLSNSQNNSNSSTNNNSQSGSGRSHPLLPDSVHVPKSVTLIPVNPNAMNTAGSSGSGRGSSNPPEKSGSGTSNRLNAHTFTHPITNKSLHQITVTEVPPPKSGRSSPANNNNNNSSGGSIGSVNNSGAHSSSSGSSSSSGPSNPIEKVIANATNKPQFNGPGSMEITKIYCGMKENPAKKLKERKGLDISISVPGIKDNKSIKTQKLEETLRQKMSNSVSSGVINNNKILKGVVSQQNPSPLFNAKMPPGITIGPAGANKTSSQGINSNNNGNPIKGLGFTLPPHITAHPQQQQAIGIRNSSSGNQVKSHGDVNNKHNRPPSKDNNGGPQQQVNSNRSNKSISSENMVNGSKQSSVNTKTLNNNRKQNLGEALASMMAARNNLKSPSPPKTSNNNQSKDHKLTSSPFANQSSRDGIQSSSNSSSNCEKRALDMTSSTRKNSRDSPEPKRSRTNETSGGSKAISSSHETPLDLSGRSSRPNSNSSSPILGKNNHTTTTTSSSPNPDKLRTSSSETSSSSNNNFKKSPTPVPKVSPPTAPSRQIPSPSLNKSNSELSTTRNSQKTSISPGSSSPSILSIAQSLAQKQLLSQQQQQQQQNLHNQIMQLHQGLQSMHANQNASSNHNLPGKSSLSSSGAGGKNQGANNNMNNISGGTGSMGLNSLSQPMMGLSNNSPTNPGFDPLRNLLTLSDAAAAVRHGGKVHPMNNLIAAVGLSSHNHVGLSMPSPTSVSSGGLFSHLSPHLANSLGGKSGAGMFDPSSHAHLFGNLQALSAAHHERLAVAAGFNHFGGSLSPPLSHTNSFFSQVRPPSSNPHGSLRIPTVTPKSSSFSINNSNKKGSTPPLSFSHPPTIPSPHSPNHNTSTLATKARSSPPVSLSSNPSSSSSNSTTSHSSKSSSSESYSSSANMKMKNIKINGTLSNQLPIYPPGIHNPLLPIYSRAQTSATTSSSSGGSNNNNNINSSATSTKVINSDKKGIPNSMKISNFLPSKPKDGKTIDNSNVEATITSGSHVGGTSLTKFLNSIPPLITSQSQANSSVSSSTAPLLKENSNRTAPANKSTNVQESISVGTSSSKNNIKSPSTLNPDDCNSSSRSNSLVNLIKNEPESNKSQSKASSDPISHVASIKTTSPTPQASSTTTSSEGSKTKDIVKTNSCEIKIEEGGLTTVGVSRESCSGKVTLMGHSTVGILGLNKSPPSTSSGRTTQPQNQAVRQIPNPALLFNRQNSNNSNNQIDSLIAPLSKTNAAPSSLAIKISSSCTETVSSEKPGLFNQTSSLKLDVEHPFHQVPAIPCPGVSVPVQVKVDHDASPIPIPVVDSTTVKENLTQVKCMVENSQNIAEAKVTIAKDASSNFTKEKEAKSSERVNQICKEEEIMKIEYNLEDADVDIDVGTETGPNLFSNEDNDVAHNETIEKSQQEQQKTLSLDYITHTTTEERQISNETQAKVEVVASLQIESSAKLQSLSPVASANQIKIENTTQVANLDESNVIKDNLLPTEESATEVKSDSQEVVLDSAICSLPSEEEKEENQMEIESQVNILSSSANANEKVSVKEENINEKETASELVVAEAEDVVMDEPMEVNVENKLASDETKSQETTEIISQEVTYPSLSLDLVESSSAEIIISEAEAPMEVIEESVADDENSTEFQIDMNFVVDSVVVPPPTLIDNTEEMECEISQDQQNDLEEAMMDNNTNSNEGKEVMELESFEVGQAEPSSSISILEETDHNDEASMSKINCKEISIQEPVAVKEEMEEANIIDEPQPQSSFMENEVEKELLLPILISEPTIDSVPEEKEKDLNPIPNSDSNLISNQITINPEALQVVDTNEKKSADLEVAQAKTDNEPANIKETLQESVVVLENKLEEELMESSSSSQLELNCPSADTNGIELSNPVTTELIVQPDNSDFSIDHSQKEIDMNESEKCKEPIQEENSEKVPILSTISTTTTTSVPIEFEVENTCAQSEEKSQNIIIQPENTTSMDPISTNVQEETPTENCIIVTDPPKAITEVETSIDNSSVTEPEITCESEQQEEKQKVSVSSPEVISATATITTTTTTAAEISTAITKTVEIEVDITENALQSPISPITTITSPMSPDCNINKMEHLEKVAAGLFASAATSINNNNNTSLSINTPCDITITTSNANDMTTV